MKLSLQELKVVYPNQIWQELLAKDLTQKESIIHKYSNHTAASNADLNRLCLNGFVAWVKANLDVTNSPKILPTEADLPSIWEVVNGCAIALNKTRLVLIPEEATDTEVLTVPQEWVDIAYWAADYYLAVQVDMDAGWMCVWGYTSHRTLKQKSSYDPIYRTYSLERDYIITDLDLLWLAMKMGLDEKTTVQPLTLLAESSAEALLERLSQPSPYSPRLDVAFEQWAALVAHNGWRRYLYSMRLKNTVIPASFLPTAVNLRQWLKQDFMESARQGWQAITALFDSGQNQLAFAVRSGSHSSKEKIPPQGKLINLRMQRQEIAVVLLVALTKEADGRVGVLIQLHPTEGQKYLPPNLKLVLLFDSTVLEGTSRERDVYVELPYFKCQPGTLFRVQIALADTSFIEEFCIPQNSNYE